MNIEKFNVIQLENNKKIIILEKLEYNGTTYLYVDDVKDDESDTLDNYYIMKLNNNNTLSKETNIDILGQIIPIFGNLIQENYK